MKLTSLIFTITGLINFICLLVYSTIGSLNKSNDPPLIYIFYIFRPEYMVISGLISLLAVIVSSATLFGFLIIKHNFKLIRLLPIIINIIYIIFYLRWISIQ